jgi:plastocyanin
MHRSFFLFSCGLLALFTIAARAETFEVIQKNKTFSVPKLKAKVGDTIVFKNDDPFFHNIFSLSETQTFDLGSFPQGQSRKLTLAKEGKVEIECAIHPEMKLIVEVAK